MKKNLTIIGLSHIQLASAQWNTAKIVLNTEQQINSVFSPVP